MTDLSGVFETDLAPPDALTACVDGLDSLGWEVESVEARRVLSHAGGQNGASPTVEIDLADTEAGTDIRIAGADSDQAPLDEGRLAEVLDAARDAIGDSIEQLPQAPAAGDVDEDDEVEEGTGVWTPVPEPVTYPVQPDHEAAPLEQTAVRPGPAAAGPVEPGPPRSGTAGPSSWWDRNKRIVTVGALVFILGAGVGAAAVPGGGTKTVKRTKTKTIKGEVRTRTQVSTVTQTVSTVVATPPPSTSLDSAGGSTAPSSSSASPSSPAGDCDPSYAPQCLDPNASDYDCLGGGGDGPKFVQGPVSIVGDDHYGLDTSDHDGVGCE